ncbi:ABC transporter permease [Roseateles sp. GG27B]
MGGPYRHRAALLALTLCASAHHAQHLHRLGRSAGRLRQAGRALGFSRTQSLRLIELPLALPTVVAGIRTATSIAVGTATIAAFIGAGGFGERIVTGLALNDKELLLAGALPSALLALGFEALFGALAWFRRRVR